MTRTEQLRTCRKCHNINFSVKKGFICSVTYDYATFNETCGDFKQATFISNKKVLKPSQLTVIEKVNKSTSNIKLKKILGILVIIILGSMMLEDPYLFSMNPQEITDSIARKTLNFIWGIPSGLLTLSIGFYLTYRFFTKKPTNL